jgi:hypothetical protein
MRYAGFQLDQLSKGDEGNTTINLVNLGHYAGGHNTSEDVINGKKKIVYDLDERGGQYGHAGEDNMTIHLAKQAILKGNAEGYDQKAAMYTSTFVREGFLIDQWKNADLREGVNTGAAGSRQNYNMEWDATKVQASSLAYLKYNKGIGTGYEDKDFGKLLGSGTGNVLSGKEAS